MFLRLYDNESNVLLGTSNWLIFTRCEDPMTMTFWPDTEQRYFSVGNPEEGALEGIEIEVK